MRRTILLYSLALAVFILLLRFLQYRYIIRELTVEFYMGILAVVFTAIGIWTGLKITRKKTIIIKTTEFRTVSDFQLDESQLEKLGISKREHEVLELIASGLSNQEIADKLFVSVNTIKTHLANLFSKLDVRRRTQAIQKGKELRLIP